MFIESLPVIQTCDVCFRGWRRQGSHSEEWQGGLHTCAGSTTVSSKLRVGRGSPKDTGQPAVAVGELRRWQSAATVRSGGCQCCCLFGILHSLQLPQSLCTDLSALPLRALLTICKAGNSANSGPLCMQMYRPFPAKPIPGASG